MSYRGGQSVGNGCYRNFCKAFEPKGSQPEQFRFEVFKLRVGKLVTHDTLLKPCHADWETAETSDEAQQQWDKAIPNDIGNRRLAHYLNAFAIDVDDTRKVSAFIRSFLAHISLDDSNVIGSEREARIRTFYDHPIDDRGSALVRTMDSGDAILLRDLIELCRDVALSSEDSKMLCRFLRVYRIDTSDSEEILAFFDIWVKYPQSYRGDDESRADFEKRSMYVNCDLGAGVTPLQSALQLADLDVARWLVKLGARARSGGSNGAGASE